MNVAAEVQSIKDRYPRKTRTPYFLAFGALILICACVLIFILPAKWPWMDISKTGQIGDTIGGIAGPIVGILGAVLIYMSFKEQLEANRIQRQALNDEILRTNNAKDMDIFLRLYEMVKENINEFEYRTRRGAEGIDFFSLRYGRLGEGIPDDQKIALKVFDQIISQLYAICIKVNSSQFSEEDNQLTVQLFLYLFLDDLKIPLDRIILMHQNNSHLSDPKIIYINLRQAVSDLMDEAAKDDLVL